MKVFIGGFRWQCYRLNKIEMSRGILTKIRNIIIHENVFFIFRVVKWRQTDRREWRKRKTHLCNVFPETHPKSYTVNIYCLPIAAHTQTQCLWCSACYSTAHLLYKYCTNCTICNWTGLTIITQKLLLHVQLHNSTAHLLYKYCTNYTICNWTVLTVITQKLLLHVQLHNNTTHLLYKYCTNSTVYNWIVLTVITQKLLLHVQLHNREKLSSWYLLMCRAVIYFIS